LLVTFVGVSTFVATTTSAVEANAPASSALTRQRLVLIDDDELTREVLTLMTAEAGLDTTAFESGEAALAHIAGLDCKSRPHAVVTDMQMPGLAGGALAVQLRTLCGPGTVILAMSGSRVAENKLTGFDGFLLKPFSANDLIDACARTPANATEGVASGESALSETVYQNFASKMQPAQVTALYQMCLTDAAQRIAIMRKASETRDDESYRRAAHAIKGGCGMVGAIELTAMAAAMEENGLPPIGDSTPLESFLVASARLGRMLEDKAKDPQTVSVAI
jgi:CheY-like chemotaxis protein